MEYRININPDKLNLNELWTALKENKVNTSDLIIVDGCSSQSEFYEAMDIISNKWAKRPLRFQIGLSDTGKKFYGGHDQ